MADMDDPVVKTAMQGKYPARAHSLPDTVYKATCMDAMPGLKDSLLELAPGVSTGFGGLRNDHLRCAAQNWGEAEESLLEGFALQYVNGLLPPLVVSSVGHCDLCTSLQDIRARPQ